ncbi:MAG: hypothetical protein AB1791_05910 [Chloroflexota bacterium]
MKKYLIMTISSRRRPAIPDNAWQPGLALLLFTLFLGLNPHVARSQPSTFNLYFPIAQRAPQPAATGPAWGLNFISSAEDPADEQQYLNGLSTGAAWNRWPLYWYNVEQSPGVFNWANADAALEGDVAHGLLTDLIFLGTPSFYTTAGMPDEVLLPAAGDGLYVPQPLAAAPTGLYDPIFTDNSDVPGPGKSINPANVWARFVYTAVNRYKPGGELAQANGWADGVGVTHWEIWNEADLDIFWDSSLADYARLVKVAYLTIEQADPDAQVIFGGLANSATKLNYYNDVMALYDADPLAATYNYFHDVMATHSYFYAWNSWYHVFRAGNTLAARGLSKPIWLNESGVAAWNDYPGPTWDTHSGYRGTVDEQADYVIQSAFYAAYAGADAIFHFQLYDGCGNQPRGTDFPPHGGELCDANGNLITNPAFPCAGDANGLFSNPTDAACFTQHPTPESPRPNYDAYRTLTTHLNDAQPLWRLRPGGEDPANGPQEWVAFWRPSTGERIVGLWARFGEAQTAIITATHTSAQLVSVDGSIQTITPVNGFYTIQLPAATNLNAPWDPTLYAIGGRPYILIEPDTTAPDVAVETPTWNGNSIDLVWSANDNLGSGVATYDVSVVVDGGAAVPWLQNTTATSGSYTAALGHTYTFYLTARDQAGNVGAAVSVTLTTNPLDQRVYLPIVLAL